MARLLHVIDSHSATWSALGALERIQSGAIAGIEDHRVLILPQPTGENRAAVAGLGDDLHRLPSRRERRAYDGVVAWDESAAHWCQKRRAPAAAITGGIPIDQRRLTRTDRSTRRRAMGVNDNAVAVAWLGAQLDETTVTGLCVLLTAVTLAGYGVAGVILDTPAPSDVVNETMRRLGAPAVVCRSRQAPWTTLVGCDFALAPAGALGLNPIGQDLHNWARAAGVTLITPASQGSTPEAPDQRRQRFGLARSLVHALEKRSDSASNSKVVGSGADDESNFADWLRTTLDAVSPSAHSFG